MFIGFSFLICIFRPWYNVLILHAPIWFCIYSEQSLDDGFSCLTGQGLGNKGANPQATVFCYIYFIYRHNEGDFGYILHGDFIKTQPLVGKSLAVLRFFGLFLIGIFFYSRHIPKVMECKVRNCGKLIIYFRTMLLP